ncbi:DNA (cytosine-5-)-methyltransferase [Oceanospirillum sediminis]|uniref:Cytosine-specific methyltransferase n=1 Tax=Oceanospirillum sediminis TaxID=2760088 RepID=A0A839IWW0_9GAMM|nr:DNA (cytosine-5-)-methyltransferase [Oceanospirillum sediminis]MBB1489180.1 DNA (cytosine-5-)-methyltransferase [Oceanospirillum sediminis]
MKIEDTTEELALLMQVLQIYDQKFVANYLNSVSPDRWSRETINRWAKGKAAPKMTHTEFTELQKLLPTPPDTRQVPGFKFIDLFAGIGGIRKGFEAIGGQCVLTSEWNKFAVRTYKANHYCDPEQHIFNDDIRKITLSGDEGISEQAAYEHIDRSVPDHDVLLAGFPCQPFSIAGVSKKNALGRAHGFECTTQGTLFFDVARILKAKKPAAFLLENVKNLKSHDGGKTFRVILETLDELGYWVSDAEATGASDPKIIDGKKFLPQHRERIVLVGFRKDLDIHQGFTLNNITQQLPEHIPSLGDLLEKKVDDKYILTPKLWAYLHSYALKHKAKGNGFGYGLVNENSTTRTLSARYYKDGSEILIDRGWDDKAPFDDPVNQANRPRRLTPRECARLMGFEAENTSDFRIPVSDTQAYKQFGNSVVVPVFSAVARLMKDRIYQAVALRQSSSDTE